MALRLWIDDLRSPPDESWTWVKSALAAVVCLRLNIEQGEAVERVSFDHDLGYRGSSRYVQDEHDSREVVRWLEEKVAAGEMSELPVLEVHSANPVGRRWLEQAFDALPRLRERLFG